MSRILAVAVREFVETVKSKFFLISILITPLLILAIAAGAPMLIRHIKEGARPPKKVAVVDLSDGLRQELDQGFGEYNRAHADRQIDVAMHGPEAEGAVDGFKEDIRKGRLDGCMVIGKGAETGEASRFFMKTERIADLECFDTVRGIFNDIVIARRLREHQLSPALFETIRRPAPVLQVDVAAETEEKGPDPLRMMAPFFFMFIMMMALFGTSQGMLTSVIEEKNSRVAEVLLSSLAPFELMAGKILGLAAVGLTVVTIWCGAAFGAAAQQGVLSALSPAASPELLICLFFYFILGYLLYSSIYAAVGAACNSLKEAQPLLMPIMLAIIIPMSTWMLIVQFPKSLYARILSLFPLTSPLTMPLRLSAEPNLPVIEVVLSLALLGATVPLVMWAAAKIFRTGLLMYGKPASFRELFRWVCNR